MEGLEVGNLDRIRPIDYVQQNCELLDRLAMAKSSGAHHTESGKTQESRASAGGWATRRSGEAGQFATVHATQVDAVMAAAERSGLLHEKSGRIGGRVSPALVEQAKARTGIATDTDLIEFALANIAIEDNFADAFRRSRGKVDPDLKLGF
jgi:hypothetical protein